MPSTRQSVPAPKVATARRLKFVVVGQVRSGMGVVASTLNNHGDVVCHEAVFHPEAPVRREAHEGYFGPSVGRRPSWFCQGDRVLEGGEYSNPTEYITDVLFKHANNDERAVGVCVPYGLVRRYELYDLFTECCRRGDFCLVHVVRNPVVCYVSLKQAEASNRWRRLHGECKERFEPSPIHARVDELVEFVRAQQTVRDKVAKACTDAVEIQYGDMVGRYERVMYRLFEFLEVCYRRPLCTQAKLLNRPLRSRLLNLAEVQAALPREQRALLSAPEPC